MKINVDPDQLALLSRSQEIEIYTVFERGYRTLKTKEWYEPSAFTLSQIRFYY